MTLIRSVLLKVPEIPEPAIIASIVVYVSVNKVALSQRDGLGSQSIDGHFLLTDIITGFLTKINTKFQNCWEAIQGGLKRETIFHKPLYNRTLRFISRVFRGRRRAPGSRQETGSWGEKQAEKHLKKEKNFTIVGRNWRHRRDEVDLVGWDEGVLVFVEVRTRRAEALVAGFYSVKKDKKRGLRRVCKAYLSGLAEAPKHFRFDIVEVRYSSIEKFTVNHYENIPLFGKGYHPTGVVNG